MERDSPVFSLLQFEFQFVLSAIFAVFLEFVFLDGSAVTARRGAEEYNLSYRVTYEYGHQYSYITRGCG